MRQHDWHVTAWLVYLAYKDTFPKIRGVDDFLAWKAGKL